MPRAGGREMLRGGGLIELQRVLQLLHGPLSRCQQLEDADARGMTEGTEQIGLEALKLRRRHYIKIFEYIEDRVKARATQRRARRWHHRGAQAPDASPHRIRDSGSGIRCLLLRRRK